MSHSCSTSYCFWVLRPARYFMCFSNFLRIWSAISIPQMRQQGPQRVKLTSSTPHSWFEMAIEYQVFSCLTSKPDWSSSGEATVSPSCPGIFTGDSGDEPDPAPWPWWLGEARQVANGTWHVFEAILLHVMRSRFGNRRAAFWLFPREKFSVTEGEQYPS